MITDLYDAGLIFFPRATIESLPDNVLLDIFDFYQEMADRMMEWHLLVRVCRRWRCLAFASPHRLRLQLECGLTSPGREMLNVWPSMEIIIIDTRSPTDLDKDCIIAAVEHRDHVCEIYLQHVTSSLLEQLATVMQEPFPVLRDFSLTYFGQTPAPRLPDTFLRSAPCLQSLHLAGIPFPALPKFLSSARQLVCLTLRGVPHTGYFSPEAMVTYLSGLTSLQVLNLGFQSPSSRPDRRSQRPLLLTRVDLPALTLLEFTGVSEYLEDFLVRINTPVIVSTMITFFNRVNFHIPQLFKFISRTETHESLKQAHLFFDSRSARLSVSRPDLPRWKGPRFGGFPNVRVRCNAFDWKISFLVQICGQLLPLLSSVERLDIICEVGYLPPSDQQDDVDHTQWLEIFRPFIAVQSLHIRGLDALIAPALRELTWVRAMEVLPALCSLFVTDPDTATVVRHAIGPFITARQLSNQPVTVHHEDEEEQINALRY